MDQFTPEQWDAILKIIGGAAVVVGGLFRWWMSRQNAKIRIAQTAAEEAQTEAKNTTALIGVLDRQQGTLEKILQRSIDAEERQRIQIETFTQTIAANAAAKTGLTDAVHDTSTKVALMATSLDKNTEVLQVNTQTVGTHTVSVESVVASLRDVSERLGALETKFDQRDESDRLTFHAATDALNEAIKRVQAMAPTPPQEHHHTGSVEIVPKADEPTDEAEDKSA